MSKSEYHINIVKILNMDLYYVLDFTITRPIIFNCNTEEQALYFAKGYKAGIEINSYLEFEPIIQNIETASVLDDYLEDKKKYYNKLWKKHNKNITKCITKT